MSRIQPSSSSGSPISAGSVRDSSSPHRVAISDQPSSSTQPRISEGSESYPSWLPRRPPPPGPGSTLHSSNGVPEAGLTPTEPFSGGRKPTPRSVRVVSLQDPAQAGGDPRGPTAPLRFASKLHPRVWSRATTAQLSPTLMSAAVDAQGRTSRPRFRSTGLHPELLRNPSTLARIYFYLLPFITFFHLPLQTFFDFNAIFMLVQVAKHPNPAAPNVPGSGKNWAFGAAAYLICWLAWIMLVFVLYELVYSFYRRWRIKRPYIVPLYLSSSAFNCVCMTSYTNFCFMQYIRFSAVFGENGSLRDGLAETFWFYSQNLPTVALLLPRAGLALALLLAFSQPNPEYVALVEAGFDGRDRTFFRVSDGALTTYARGVLTANVAWSAWRFLVLTMSWIGLWILSGQACAGICGPRYRWEEEEHEKAISIYSDGVSEADALPWVWRVCTRLRIQEAYDFCLTVKPPSRLGISKKEGDDREVLGISTTPAFDVEQVLAAVGLPSASTPARRVPLSGDLFKPKRDNATIPGLADLVPKVVRSSTEHGVAGPSAPLSKLPYPLTGYGVQASSKDQIPFPPSPGSRKEKRRSPVTSSVVQEDDSEEEEEEEEEEVEEVEESSEAHPRTSGSMSSLGQPIMSRYPFQFRRPHARGGSLSSAAVTRSSPQSDGTPSSNSRSSQTRSTQSTGNGETSSDSPMSRGISSVMSSPTSRYGTGSPIPMPPRHPQPGRGRARAGTVPAMLPSSPSSMASPVHISTRHTRVHSQDTGNVGLGYDSFLSDPHDEEEEEEEEEEPRMMEQPEPEGPHEAAEGEDSVGLLGVMPRSPRSSNVSSRRRRGRRDSHSGSYISGSSSQSRSTSSRSRAGSAVRSRAQSFIQNLSAASRSSLDLMHSRANSMVRLEEDPNMLSSSSLSSNARSRSYSRGSASASASTSEGVQSTNGEAGDHTFGRPIRVPMYHQSRTGSVNRLRPAASSPSMSTASMATFGVTGRSERLTVPVRERVPLPERRVTPSESRAGSSTGAQSFVSARDTLGNTTPEEGGCAPGSGVGRDPTERQ